MRGGSVEPRRRPDTPHPGRARLHRREAAHGQAKREGWAATPGRPWSPPLAARPWPTPGGGSPPRSPARPSRALPPPPPGRSPGSAAGLRARRALPGGDLRPPRRRRAGIGAEGAGPRAGRARGDRRRPGLAAGRARGAARGPARDAAQLRALEIARQHRADVVLWGEVAKAKASACASRAGTGPKRATWSSTRAPSRTRPGRSSPARSAPSWPTRSSRWPPACRGSCSAGWTRCRPRGEAPSTWHTGMPCP